MATSAARSYGGMMESGNRRDGMAVLTTRTTFGKSVTFRLNARSQTGRMRRPK